MSNKLQVRVAKLFKVADWTIIGLTVCFLIFTCSIFFWAAEDSPTEKAFGIQFYEFLKAISPDLTAASLLFLVSFMLLRKYDAELAAQRDENLVENVAQRVLSLRSGIDGGAVELHNNFNEIQWRQLIQKAAQIDICAQYCESWMGNLDKYFVEFFERGGKARVVVPDFENDEQVKWIAKRSEDRQNGGLERVRTKINDTYTKLLGICGRRGASSASFEGYLVSYPLMYTAVQFDKETLILAWYENIRDEGTNCPAVRFNLPDHPVISKWFNTEFDKLTGRATTKKETVLGGSTRDDKRNNPDGEQLV